jgi:LytS/YehU family sensor histidine kinase
MHALEAQLRPHFLFNTLNLIAELVHEAPETADAMLTRLGHLLRRAYQATAHVVPLAEELDFVVAYAEILTCRYGERATLRVDVPTAARGLQVPAFALQPLVENAFRHGVERREGTTTVDVSAAVRAGQLVLRVRDRGTGASAHRTRADDGLVLDTATLGGRTGSGVGLRNTRERLAALYGDAAGLALVQAQDTTVATLWLPAVPVVPAVPTPRALARSGERR